VHGFGIATEFRGLKDVAQRTTFLVDETGLIRQAWRYDTGQLPDIDEWLVACRTLQSTPEPG
jgi:peroxiredoxin